MYNLCWVWPFWIHAAGSKTQQCHCCVRRLGYACFDSVSCLKYFLPFPFSDYKNILIFVHLVFSVVVLCAFSITQNFSWIIDVYSFQHFYKIMKCNNVHIQFSFLSIIFLTISMCIIYNNSIPSWNYVALPVNMFWVVLLFNYSNNLVTIISHAEAIIIFAIIIYKLLLISGLLILSSMM